ncbi:P-selectin-like [Heterodontus francisci]|uniref:P-selectin-like n=1 Tax=Heterodontus francisci TaxID=7792 RepID=UPI00355AF3CC
MTNKVNQPSPLIRRGGSQLWFFTIIILELLFLEGIHGWTYKPVAEPMPWENARRYCQTKYTDLVAIQNAREIEYLNDILPFAKQYYWIGIRKINGNWTWVGTNISLNKEAENWAHGEPNNEGASGNEDCVEMYIKRRIDTGKWNDINCNMKKIPLCYLASCTPTSCSGHGECVETIGNYTCACNDGYYGPECEYVEQCVTLDVPGQATMKCTHPNGNFSFNSICNFHCAAGFTVQGSQSLRCNATGMWTAETPSCEVVRCRGLEIPGQGFKNCSHPIGDFSYNSTCDFSCAKGFELQGSDRLECGASGEWSAPIPNCEAVKCGSLMIPGQGIMACSHPIGNFSYNSTCDFSCAEGFELRGSDRVECGASGEWSAPIPDCEAIKCERLEVPNQGFKNCSHPLGKFNYNSTCVFSCAKGFELRGSDRLECGASGEWSAPIPNCKAVKCGSLMIPGQGIMACSHPIGNFSYNSTCDFSCAEGFELRGSDRVECGASGEWSAPIPDCEAIKCERLEVPNQGFKNCSHPLGKFNYNSTCVFSCAKGFELRGSDRLECGASGEWSAPIPNCKAVKCGSLMIPGQGIMACSHPIGNFSYNSTCDFSCAEGFELRGSDRVECGASGEWSAPIPDCEAIKCERLEVPNQGFKNCSHPLGKFNYNSTCVFSCAKGFELRGSDRLECGASGEWSAPIPNCKAVKCGSLMIPGQGIMACSHPIGNFSYNSTCDFSCAEGFELRGSDKLECGASGEWSAPIPHCEAVQCENLENQEQVTMTCSNPIVPFIYNSTCDFNCPEGFALSGSSRIKCEATGQWTAPMPTCKAKPCNLLKVPEQANMNCSHPAGNFTYSSTCYFSCAEGFMLKGSKKLECGATGQWTAHPPTCEAVKCDDPKIPKNGNINCSHPIGNFSYHSTCDFGCVEGFSLNGSMSLQCVDSGTWSSPIPTCEDSAPKPMPDNDTPILTASAAASGLSAITLIAWIVRQLRKKAQAKKFSLPSNDKQNKASGTYKMNDVV